MTDWPAGAAATVYFDDVTTAEAPESGAGRRLNFDCADVSKSHVAEVFESVFGYPLALDPTMAVGDIVEKYEKNGVHDGAVVRAPMAPRAGYVYQRLVDTTHARGLTHDLRTSCVGGEPVLVWIKRKPPGRRCAALKPRRRPARAGRGLFGRGTRRDPAVQRADGLGLGRPRHLARPS
jgi:hypothetical protein